MAVAIHESGENYLEQIYVLSKQNETVRAVDLCTALGYSRPTVSIMLRTLRENGFVTVQEKGGLALTPEGLAVAKRMYDRHCMLAEVLMSIGVSREVALEDACKIEHDLSDETIACLRRYLDGISEGRE